MGIHHATPLGIDQVLLSQSANAHRGLARTVDQERISLEGERSGSSAQDDGNSATSTTVPRRVGKADAPTLSDTSTAAGSSSGGQGQRRARSGTQRAPDMESSPKRSRPAPVDPEGTWIEDTTQQEDPDTAFMSMGKTSQKGCPHMCPKCLANDSTKSYCIYRAYDHGNYHSCRECHGDDEEYAYRASIHRGIHGTG